MSILCVLELWPFPWPIILFFRRPERAEVAGGPSGHFVDARRKQGGPADAALLPARCHILGGGEPDDADEPGCLSGTVALPSQHTEERDTVAKVCIRKKLKSVNVMSRWSYHNSLQGLGPWRSVQQRWHQYVDAKCWYIIIYKLQWKLQLIMKIQ